MSLLYIHLIITAMRLHQLTIIAIAATMPLLSACGALVATDTSGSFYDPTLDYFYGGPVTPPPPPPPPTPGYGYEPDWSYGPWWGQPSTPPPPPSQGNQRPNRPQQPPTNDAPPQKPIPQLPSQGGSLRPRATGNQGNTSTPQPQPQPKRNTGRH